MGRKAVVPDSERASLIRWAFETFSQGVSPLEEVRRKVNQKELKTWNGKEISSQLMHKIMTNPFYIGIMTVGGKEYQGNHTPIVSDGVFYTCQKRLKKQVKGDVISKSRTNVHFPLRNFVRCAYCGKPLTGSFSKGRWGGLYPYYKCYDKACDHGKSIAKKKLEGEFVKYLSGITPKHSFLKAFKPVIIEVWQRKYKELNHDRQQAVKAIEDLRKEKVKLIDMKKKELLSDEDFKEALHLANQKIADRQVFLLENQTEEFNVDEVVTYVFDFIKDIPEFWKQAGYEQRIQLQGLIFLEKPIYTYPGFETPQLSLVLQQSHSLARGKKPMVPHQIEICNPLILEIQRWYRAIPALVRA